MRNLILPLFILTGICWSGCKDDAYQGPENPYDKQKPAGYDKVNDGDTTYPPTTIQALHRQVFAPTCANSGCHDGTFEPDFRTVESTYSTLLFEPPIKNDELNPLQARVVPGNADASMLIKRLEVDLNGNSGIMPLSVDPQSDWRQKKDTYIAWIRQWINDGAKDQLGNDPPELNFPPQIQGMIGRINGVPVNRNGIYNSLEVPVSTSSLDLWFSFADDHTATEQLSYNKVNFSLFVNDFESSNEQNLTYEAQAIRENGFYRQEVDFHHRIRINPSTLGAAGTILWIRTYMSDDGTRIFELPNNNSLFDARRYFSIKLVP